MPQVRTFAQGARIRAKVRMYDPETQSFVDPEGLDVRFIDESGQETVVAGVRADTEKEGPYYYARIVLNTPGTWRIRAEVTNPNTATFDEEFYVTPTRFA